MKFSTDRGTLRRAVAKVTITSRVMEEDDDLRGWEFSFEVEPVFQSRDRLGTVNGWSVHAPVDDHPPAHVHCRKDDVEVVVYFDDFRVKRKRGKPKENDIGRVLKGIQRHEKFYRRAYDNVRRRHRGV